MLRILANDGIDEQAKNRLEALGMNVEITHLEKDELMKFGGFYDVIIVRSATKMTKQVLQACAGKRLKLIIRAGVGLDNIDLEVAKKLGYQVNNTPNASSNAVAELALGHMLSLARFISISNVTMRNGEWNKKQYNGTEIFGKTLGIIGFGRIGRALAQKAKLLGMNVIFYDAYVKEWPGFQAVTLEECLQRADFISIHTSSVEKPIIGYEEIQMMKDDVFIINAARGNVIDEEALLNGLENGKIAGAGMDVFCNEPCPNKALCHHPRVSLTPHIGANTKEAQMRIGQEIVEIVKAFAEEVDHAISQTV